MPLRGVRVLDLSDLAGALSARLLGDLGADVVRVEPPPAPGRDRMEVGEFTLPAEAHRSTGVERPRGRGRSQIAAQWFYNTSKRGTVLDTHSPAGARELERLVRAADVVIDARSAGEVVSAPVGAALDARAMRTLSPRTIVVRITPFGMTGPRAGWQGSDLVCAARGGMVFVNGHPETTPIAPFGLAAYTAVGVWGAIAALVALRARERNGRGALVDLSIAAAVAGAVEHVTGFYRQTGSIERRRGTLHWSRTFRIGPCRDGWILHCLLGDWTSLAEWVESESAGIEGGEFTSPAEAHRGAGAESLSLRDPRWDDPNERKAHCEALFDRLDRWSATRSVEEMAAGAALRRLAYAAVRAPESLACDEQLRARGFVLERERDGQRVRLPGAPFRMTRTPWQLRRLPPRLGEHVAEVRSDPTWQPQEAPHPSSRMDQARKPLDGVRVLDFTWVVAGPVATRILADQGARVIKVERPGAADFGTRRGGLTGNLNRGKQSIVLDLSRPRGLELARRLAGQCDVVIDNFSARVMGQWGLDYPELSRLRHDVIAVRLSGFGLSGPRRDDVSYGPTLQALVGLPFLMRLSGEAPAGWGYSWSDMAAGMMGALATLAALRHRDRTGEGQLVDLAQLETLVSLLGPRVLDLLRGDGVSPPGNASQEGDAAPHGVYRSAAELRSDGSMDDDRWVAIAVMTDQQWQCLAEVLGRDGESWALAGELADLEARLSLRALLDQRISAWARIRAAEEIEDRLQAAGVPAGLVANGEDLAHDAQLGARGYFATVQGPDGGVETFDGVPFLSSNMPGAVAGPGPLLGEHGDVVLTELLGLSREEIAALRLEGVVG